MNRYSIYMKYKDSYIITDSVLSELSVLSAFTKDAPNVPDTPDISLYIRDHCYTTDYKDEKNTQLAIRKGDDEYLDYDIDEKFGVDPKMADIVLIAEMLSLLISR